MTSTLGLSSTFFPKRQLEENEALGIMVRAMRWNFCLVAMPPLLRACSPFICPIPSLPERMKVEEKGKEGRDGICTATGEHARVGEYECEKGEEEGMRGGREG